MWAIRMYSSAVLWWPQWWLGACTALASRQAGTLAALRPRPHLRLVTPLTALARTPLLKLNVSVARLRPQPLPASPAARLALWRGSPR